MSRLHQSFKSVMFMRSKYRKSLYELESKVMEEEEKAKKKK